MCFPKISGRYVCILFFNTKTSTKILAFFLSFLRFFCLQAMTKIVAVTTILEAKWTRHIKGYICVLLDGNLNLLIIFLNPFKIGWFEIWCKTNLIGIQVLLSAQGLRALRILWMNYSNGKTGNFFEYSTLSNISKIIKSLT